MRLSAIVVNSVHDDTWPLSADDAYHKWQAQGPTEFVRLPKGDTPLLSEVFSDPSQIERLLCFGQLAEGDDLSAFTALKEAAFEPMNANIEKQLQSRGVDTYKLKSQGYWAQSVAEFALALTLCGLRRIPQTHSAIVNDHAPWNYEPQSNPKPGFENSGIQFGDDDRFTNGSVQGKRVRIVGAGNIASRYASWLNMLGAEVAAWDPFANEPCFHRAGARQENHLDNLVRDAEIFAPMLPLTDKTLGLVTASLIDALPNGCLVVLVTRAEICDMNAIRRRVLSDEIALAADVFDIEPVPLGDPLLGRHNVVHTPHNAGRTRLSNEELVDALLAQFRPK